MEIFSATNVLFACVSIILIATGACESFLECQERCMALGQGCKNVIYIYKTGTCKLVGGILPTTSCKDIHLKYPWLKNGIYELVTPSGRVSTFCDMENGGWTLIGQTSGETGNKHTTWLRSSHNVGNLATPTIESDTYSCIDAVDMAVNHASLILFSSGDNDNAIGSKTVSWPLPADRDTSTLWNHNAGQSAVNSETGAAVQVTDHTGNVGNCFQTKYGIHKYYVHGGSYPSTEIASGDNGGGTSPNDLCMSIEVISNGQNENGWSQNGNGRDAPSSDTDWPNTAYSQVSHLSVWIQ